jgi:spermidine synthase
LMLCYRHTSSQIEEIQSRLNLATPLALPSAYTQAMLLALIWRPEPERMLLIGLGGGRLQMILHHYLEQVTLHTVELDPVVVEVAQRFFGICQDNRQHIIVQDGREYLRGAAAHTRYDIIMLDAYRVEGIPLHLSTQEFYNECRACLAPGGVVATNLQSGTPGYHAARKTFDAAFQHTMVFPLLGGNVIAIGSDLSPDLAPKLAPIDEQEFHTRVGRVEQRFLGQIPLAGLAQTRDNRAGYRHKTPILRDDDQPVE